MKTHIKLWSVLSQGPSASRSPYAWEFWAWKEHCLNNEMSGEEKGPEHIGSYTNCLRAVPENCSSPVTNTHWVASFNLPSVCKSLCGTNVDVNVERAARNMTTTMELARLSELMNYAVSFNILCKPFSWVHVERADLLIKYIPWLCASLQVLENDVEGKARGAVIRH